VLLIQLYLWLSTCNRKLTPLLQEEFRLASSDQTLFDRAVALQNAPEQPPLAQQRALLEKALRRLRELAAGGD
jgi:hypothetical protein